MLAYLDAQIEANRRTVGDLSLTGLTVTVRHLFTDAHFIVLHDPDSDPAIVVAVLREDGYPLWDLRSEPPRNQRATNPIRRAMAKYSTGLGAGRQEFALPLPLNSDYNPRTLSGYPATVVFGVYVGAEEVS